MRSQESITVFEHQVLKCNDCFTPVHLKILQNYYGDKGTPFFNLVNNGVKFCEYVGVLRVKGLTIEVLPKIDKYCQEKSEWRKLLIKMLRCVGTIPVLSSSESDLMLSEHSILDLYMDLFLDEVEKLMHLSLIRKYYRTEGNQSVMKGSLDFNKHLHQNFIHKERFYIKYTIYDKDNPLNQVLFKTICLIRSINTSSRLLARINSILLDFPDVSQIEVDENWFNKITYSRKNEKYKAAMQIAKLLLLNFHPDIKKGNDHVLAIMFDMNLLWEKFIYASLKRFESSEVRFRSQVKKCFWKSLNITEAGMKPDIVMYSPEGNYIFDTKWKILEYIRPSDDDLRQMYAYNKYFESFHTILIFPGTKTDFLSGYFIPVNASNKNEGNCSILKISVPIPCQSIHEWQKQIFYFISACLNNVSKSGSDQT